MLDLYKRSGNDVLEVNPVSDTIDIHITNHGSDWLWAAFSVFGLLAVINVFIFFFTSSHNRTLKRAVFVAPFLISVVMSVTYFTYASNLGYAGVPVEFHHVLTKLGLNVRQIFYVKFIGYFLSWPFVLYEIEIANNTLDVSSRTSTGETAGALIHVVVGLFTKLFCTEVMVLGLLIGVLIESTYKWGYFTFATFGALVAIILVLLNTFESRKSVKSNKFATLLILFQLPVWLLYPVAWGLSEGGNRIQPDSEAVFYGVLDLVTFAIIPNALAWINAAGLEENQINFHLARENEKLPETPRASGETAVASGVRSADGEVNETAAAEV